MQLMGVYTQHTFNKPEALGPDRFRFQGFIALVGVTDGARTRDLQGHNLALCRLSYGHHAPSHQNGARQA
jgi:hypothetical protein